MSSLKNPEAIIAKMVVALQGVVNDTRGMTDETYGNVIGALYLAGVDPFPPPVYRAVQKVSHYQDGRDWWCFNDKEKLYLCDEKGEFARFETEELAIAAIAEEARQTSEMASEFSSPKLVSNDQPIVVVPRSLLIDIAGEQPSLSDEFGNCNFCNSADYLKYPSPNSNFYQHQQSCAWVKARKIICESAGATFDADGRLSPEEFRNYLRHRGFSLVSKQVRDRDLAMLFAYLPTEVIDESPWVETAAGLEAYFVCVDNQALPLTFAQSWCDNRLSGRNIARFPAIA